MNAAHKSENGNFVLPFTVDNLNIRGRLVRLDSVIDTILRRHSYPSPVSRAVGEALVIAALLGSSLKTDNGHFQVQTKSKGPIESLVADFAAHGAMRAYARFDEKMLNDLDHMKVIPTAELLGEGILAMTIDPGNDMKQYQGIVDLDKKGFEGAANRYFEQSEQIPTSIRIAVAEHYENGICRYRAGGIMAQHIPSMGGHSLNEQSSPDQADAANDWEEGRLLLETVEDHELTDPQISAETLLYRLYHEQGVRIYPELMLAEQCQCSRERILDMISSFPEAERNDMFDKEGHIGVTCQFCSRHYDLTKPEIEASISTRNPAFRG